MRAFSFKFFISCLAKKLSKDDFRYLSHNFHSKVLELV